ncbi:hypothetical protein SDJN02_10880, partial [Cucurbita argyrosperma subsp. argyrosperma]
MAVSFSRFSLWVWNRKEKKSVANGSPSSSSSEFGNGLRESERLKFKRGVGLPSSAKKVEKQQWGSKKETRIEWECDYVMVPSGGDGMQMSESDAPGEADWSIGWLEPHGPGFKSDDSFAVLVPSYSNRCKEVVECSNVELLAAIKNLQTEFSPAADEYLILCREPEAHGTVAFFPAKLQSLKCAGIASS